MPNVFSNLMVWVVAPKCDAGHINDLWEHSKIFKIVAEGTRVAAVGVEPVRHLEVKIRQTSDKGAGRNKSDQRDGLWVFSNNFWEKRNYQK